MATKRKHTCVPLKAKLDHVKKGESHSSFASEYGIGKSTLGDLRRMKRRIESFPQQ